MKSYFKNLVRKKRKHPRAGEGDTPAGQGTSNPDTATSTTTTTTSRPVGRESPIDGTRPEAYVRKEVGPVHPRLIQAFSDSKSHQVSTTDNEPAAQVLIGTSSQGMPSPCHASTCILNPVFRRDLLREATKHPLTRRGRCSRSVVPPYSQKDHETTPPQT